MSDGMQTLIAQHNSIVPRDMVALMQLPGVGRKTAGVALMSMQNAPPVLPVDSHVFRLVCYSKPAYTCHSSQRMNRMNCLS